MYHNFYSVWYTPNPQDVIAYISYDRIAEIGGAAPETIDANLDIAHFVNQGNALLARWCRKNCDSVGRPVNVEGRTGWAFLNAQDATLFKLTWG